MIAEGTARRADGLGAGPIPLPNWAEGGIGSPRTWLSCHQNPVLREGRKQGGREGGEILQPLSLVPPTGPATWSQRARRPAIFPGWRRDKKGGGGSQGALMEDKSVCGRNGR